MAGLSPLTQPAYLQGVSTYNPSTVSSQGLDPNLVASLNPSQSIAQLQQAYLPQQQQAQQNLNQTLADFGVSGGQAVQANQQLQGLLASSIAPALANLIQGSQGMQLGAGEFNSGNALQAALANAGASNQAGQFGANATNQMNAANVGQFNQTQAQQLQEILNNYNQQLALNAGVYGQGQGAGNQQALNYGQDITVSDPFSQIFGAAASIAPYALAPATGGASLAAAPMGSWSI